jgi:hypothetical protein
VYPGLISGDGAVKEIAHGVIQFQKIGTSLNSAPCDLTFIQTWISLSIFKDYYSRATWRAVLKLARYWWQCLNFHMTPSHFVCSITQVGKKFGGIIFRMTFVLAGPHSVTIQNNKTDGYRIRISSLLSYMHYTSQYTWFMYYSEGRMPQAISYWTLISRKVSSGNSGWSNFFSLGQEYE